MYTYIFQQWKWPYDDSNIPNDALDPNHSPEQLHYHCCQLQTTRVHGIVVLYYYMSPWRVKHYQNWNLGEAWQNIVFQYHFFETDESRAWPLCHSWTCNLHSSGLTWPRYHESWVTWCLSQSFMGCVKMVWHDMMYAGTAKLKDIHRCCAMSGWRVAKKQFNLGRYPLHTWRKRLQGCGMINDHETSWIWLQ